jgi:hypothetical protein
MTKKLTKDDRRNRALKALEQDNSVIDESTDNFLRARTFVEAINHASNGLKLEPLPENYKIRSRDTKVVGLAMHTAFELCGGVPGLIFWARNNPDKFYQLWSKMDLNGTPPPGSGGQTFNFISAIPDSPLDRKTLRANGEVVELTTDGDTVDVVFDEDDDE